MRRRRGRDQCLLVLRVRAEVTLAALMHKVTSTLTCRACNCFKYCYENVSLQSVSYLSLCVALPGHLVGYFPLVIIHGVLTRMLVSWLVKWCEML